MADTQKLLQLSALLAQASIPFTQANPGQREFAAQLLGSAQAGIQAEALRKAKKEEEKKNKGLFGGKIGSLLGAAAGLAIPGVGPFASAALAAGGSAAGGALGSALGGGGMPSGADMLGYGVQGGLAGYSYGKAGELAQTAMDGAVPPEPIGTTVEKGIAQSMPDANRVLSPAGTIGPKLNPNPTTGRYDIMSPYAKMASPLATPQAKMAVKPGFGQRFGNALSYMSGFGPQPAQRRVVRNPDGTVVLEWDKGE